MSKTTRMSRNEEKSTLENDFFGAMRLETEDKIEYNAMLSVLMDAMSLLITELMEKNHMNPDDNDCINEQIDIAANFYQMAEAEIDD